MRNVYRTQQISIRSSAFLFYFIFIYISYEPALYKISIFVKNLAQDISRIDIKSHSDAIELRHRIRHFRLNCWNNVDVLFWKWRCFESNSSFARGVRRFTNSARVLALYYHNPLFCQVTMWAPVYVILLTAIALNLIKDWTFQRVKSENYNTYFYRHGYSILNQFIELGLRSFIVTNITLVSLVHWLVI